MNSEIQTSGKPIDALLERVVSMNILSSDYFKDLYRLKTYNEVVDEIFHHVDHVEPWMTGNCRGSSTAFCLLYKFFTMKLTQKQLHSLLSHPDSPYIRAIGFLYLRYMADPKTLWQWFEPYIQDSEEFSPGTNGRMTTMGVYVRDLLLNQYYFNTIFPRIPVPVLRQISAHLERLKLPTSAQGSTGSTNGRHGSDETARRPPSVKAALSVSFGQRAPHRASTRDSSPVRRNLPSNGTTDRAPERREKERDEGRERPRSRDSDYDHRDRDRDRRRDYGDTREWRRDRRERSSERSGSRYRSRSRSPREGSRRERSRYNRSRSRSPRRSSPARRSGSPGKEKGGGGGVMSANLLKLRDVYGDASGKLVENGPVRVKDSSGEDVIRLGGPTWR